MSSRPVGAPATWDTDRERCPGKTCEGPCPRSGCLCAPCACSVCTTRTGRALRQRTPLRARTDVAILERLFDPEPTPIRDRT